ncbi:hypothetical protein [Nocardia asteroides]
MATSLAWRPNLPAGGRHALLGLVLSFFFAIMLAASCVAFAQDPPHGNPLQILVSLIGLFLFPILLAIPIYALVSGAFKRARKQAKINAGSSRAYGLWQNAYYCHRCGTVFWPLPTALGVPHRVALTPNQFRWHVWSAGGYAKL